MGEGGGGGPGVTGTFTFTPTAADVIAYDYQFGEEPEQIVVAGADGTASVTWTPTSYPNASGGWMSLRVRSHSANGLVSDWSFDRFQINAMFPTVTSDIYQWPNGGGVGQAGTFTFTAALPGSVEFVYSFDGEAEQTVAAGADGTATVTWTPASPYAHSLEVRSRTGPGVESGRMFISIYVNP
jgi:hypothetical protein